MKHAVTLIAVLVAMLSCVAASCAVPNEIVFWGDDREKPPADVEGFAPGVAPIQLDASLFFRIHTPAAGYTIAQREAIVLRRIVEAMAAGTVAPVYVDSVRNRPTVYIGRYRLITVYPADVAAAGAPSAYALAHKWANGVRKGLQITAPSWCVGDSPFPVKLGGKTLFSLSGPADYPSVGARAAAVYAKLAEIRTNFDPAQVAITPNVDSLVITYMGYAVVTVTPADAKAAGTTVQALADQWVANLRALADTSATD